MAVRSASSQSSAKRNSAARERVDHPPLAKAPLGTQPRLATGAPGPHPGESRPPPMRPLNHGSFSIR
ncbi:hypothetical protein XH88_36295 [Bradyrhizobium sp. CCBAU 51627]|nr:hypothetical protein [Bradyrhizobium sp. CCBAU 51627]